MDKLSFASYFELCVAVPNNSGPAIESYGDLAGFPCNIIELPRPQTIKIFPFR